MIQVVLGDISERVEQAIVNSANPQLMAGGGVCGAIHQAAGPITLALLLGAVITEKRALRG